MAKKKYEDDGHTIYDMNVDAYWRKDKKNKESSITVTKEEHRLLIKAAFVTYFPRLLLVILCFGITMLLLYFWLK